jgi:hypothetical protein
MRNKFFLITFALSLLISMMACNTNKTITMKAALIYKAGAAQPVARKKFYLLKEDVSTKERTFFTSKSSAKAINDTTAATSAGSSLPPLSDGINESNIKDYIVTTTETDFDGNAKFQNVPSGTFYIVGYTTTREEFGYIVWNVKIDTTKSTETVFLDQNNAFKMSSY